MPRRVVCNGTTCEAVFMIFGRASDGKSVDFVQCFDPKHPCHEYDGGIPAEFRHRNTSAEHKGMRLRNGLPPAWVMGGGRFRIRFRSGGACPT